MELEETGQMPQSTRASIAGAAVAAALTLAPVPGLAPKATAAAELRIGADVKHFRLENGLEVVVIPDHRAPVVTHMIWYRVGAADEPRGSSGIAHFLEHLMFKGTKDHPEGEFSRTVAEIGGQENAFTSQDYTAYFQRVAKQHLPRVMEFEADRMANLVLTDEVVRPERDVIIEERRQRVDNEPSSLLSEVAQSTLYQNHPYGMPIIGWRHEIEKLSRQDAIAFYDRYYTPNNAVLVVAGDVTAEEVRGLAERTYGKAARRAEPGERVRAREPEPVAARSLTLADARVEQPNVRKMWLVPSYNTAAPGESEALEVLSEVLGGRSTSHLYRKLVVEQKLASGISTWYQGSALDATTFGLYAVPRQGVSLLDLEKAVDAAVRDFLAAELSQDDVKRIANNLVADAIYAQDSQTTLARIYGVALTTGGSVEEVATWPARIMAVTAEDVKRVARTYLQPQRSVTGYLVKAEPEQRS